MIDVTSSAIYIDDGEYTFKDVYDAVQNNFFYRSKAEKAGDNSYYFDFEFYIGKNKPAVLADKNVAVEVNGEKFQIYEGSEFRLGKIDANGATSDGCTFSAPNLDLAYGFGCSDKDGNYTLSGNIYLYESHINVPCFWGFFNSPDKQIVDIKNCTINGFGRISGENTKIDNVLFSKANKRYGTFATFGKIEKFSSVFINKAESDGACLYFNPPLSGNCELRDVHFPDDYKYLVYCEEADEETVMRIVNPVGISSYNCYFKDSKAIVEVWNEVKFLSSKNVKVNIKDEDGNEIETFYTDNVKHFELRYKRISSLGEKDFQYFITIDDVVSFTITPSEPLTIDVDTYLNKKTVRAPGDTVFFLTGSYRVSLGNLFMFFVKAYREPTIELQKSNGITIATPLEIEKINGIMYKVTFLIGDLGEKGLNDQIWQDGIFLLKGYEDEYNNYYAEVNIVREEQEYTTKQDKEDLKEQIEKGFEKLEKETESISIGNGAKIIL